MMNKLTATALFDKNSCLIGNKDVIPKSEAIRLLGSGAVEFADRADSRYKNQELYMAMSKLNEKERTVVLLFYMEDQSLKEISGITGMPENTVKSHLSRARGNLSNHLNTIGYER